MDAVKVRLTSKIHRPRLGPSRKKHLIAEPLNLLSGISDRTCARRIGSGFPNRGSGSLTSVVSRTSFAGFLSDAQHGADASMPI